VLEATAPPPEAILNLLSRHKPAIVAMLCSAWSAEDWQAYHDERAGILEYDGEWPRSEAEQLAFEACVTRWLDEHPAPSQAGICAWRAQPRIINSPVVPFGTEPGSLTHLHRECWSPWFVRRKAEATATLEALGVAPHNPWPWVLLRAGQRLRCRRSPTFQ